MNVFYLKILTLSIELDFANIICVTFTKTKNKISDGNGEKFYFFYLNFLRKFKLLFLNSETIFLREMVKIFILSLHMK